MFLMFSGFINVVNIYIRVFIKEIVYFYILQSNCPTMNISVLPDPSITDDL